MFADIIANEKKARRELVKKAREEGREQERKLREQEVEQERKLREQERIETARTLLGMGMSAENVAIATKLAIDSVEELKASV